MADSTPSGLIQLQYCPICKRLVRPSMIQNGEATEQDGVLYHAACLSKGQGSAEHGAAAGRDFDDDNGVATDFQNYDKVVVESITTLRKGRPGTGSQQPVRRKTTSAATSGAQHEKAPPARRSSQGLRGYSDSRGKKSPALAFGGAAAALALIAIGSIFLFSRHGDESTPKSLAQAPTAPPTAAGSGIRNPAPVQTGIPPPPPPTPQATDTSTQTPPIDPVAPLPPPLTQPDDAGAPAAVGQLVSPYELTRLRNPDPQGHYSAGAPVELFDGVSTAGWTVTDGPASALHAQDGALLLKYPSSSFFVTHALPADSFDLTLEARFGPENSGAYLEIWLPEGRVILDGKPFQSDQWTPLEIHVRNGQLTALQGEKGSTALRMGNVSSTLNPHYAPFAGKQLLVLNVSSGPALKSLRNIRLTPYSPMQVQAQADPFALAWEPAGPPQSLFDGKTLDGWQETKGNSGAASVIDGVLTVKPGDRNAQLECALPAANYDLKFDLHFENNDAGAYAELWLASGAVKFTGADFEADGWTPVVVHVRDGKLRAECGTRGDPTLHAAPYAASVPGDQASQAVGGRNVAIFEFSTITIKYLRNVEFTPMQLKAPVASTPPVPTNPTPGPTNPQPGDLFTLPLSIPCDRVVTSLGKWFRIRERQDQAGAYLSWVKKTNLRQAPCLDLNTGDKKFPRRVKVHVKFRVTDPTPIKNVIVQIWYAGDTHVDGLVPVQAMGAWQEGDVTMDLPDQSPGQFGITVEHPTVNTDLSWSTITFDAVAAPQTPTPPQNPAVPAVPSGPTYRLPCADIQEGGGKWFRVTPMKENGHTFLRWTEADTTKWLYPFFRNVGGKDVPAQMAVRIVLRQTNSPDTGMIVHFYGKGIASDDLWMKLPAADANGWVTVTFLIKNSYTTFNEVEFKPSGQHAQGQTLDLASIDMYPAADPPPPLPADSPAAAAAASTAPNNPAAAGPLVFRLEGTGQESCGIWYRVVENKDPDGRTYVTYTDEDGKHHDAFMQFRNPNERTLPTKLHVRMCVRTNMFIGNLRMKWSTPGKNDDFGTNVPIAPDEVGQWVEKEFTVSPPPGPKDEIYFKFDKYPPGMRVDFDWLEVTDATQPAPAPAPDITPAGAATPPPGAPPPGGPAPGSRVFAIDPNAVKLTGPKTAVWVSSQTTSSLTLDKTAGEKLFDGDTLGGIFELTSTDPKTRSCWLTLDLGAEHAVCGIHVWFFSGAGATYGDQVWQVGPYDDFERGAVTVYNSDARNLHHLGAGSDADRPADKAGVAVGFVPMTARYVRIWCAGNNNNGTNHLLEIEVLGAPGDKGLNGKLPADLKVNAGRGQAGDWTPENGLAQGGLDMQDLHEVKPPHCNLALPDGLYTSLREGVQTWKFPRVADGHYWVRLHFNEPSKTAAGDRLFDVILQGQTVLKHFDVFKTAGGAHRGLVETFAVDATHQQGIRLELKMIKDAPLLAGVEVLPAEGAGPPPAPMTP
ncbi:MAG: family 16 glycoside hydrolase [Planctomycetota bacterium]